MWITLAAPILVDDSNHATRLPESHPLTENGLAKRYWGDERPSEFPRETPPSRNHPGPPSIVHHAPPYRSPTDRAPPPSPATPSDTEYLSPSTATVHPVDVRIGHAPHGESLQLARLLANRPPTAISANPVTLREQIAAPGVRPSPPLREPPPQPWYERTGRS